MNSWETYAEPSAAEYEARHAERFGERGNVNGVRIEDPNCSKRVVWDITVEPGTRAGFVEIRFPAKPEPRALTELKKARFRWSRFNGCWYGLLSKMPKRYRKLYLPV